MGEEIQSVPLNCSDWEVERNFHSSPKAQSSKRQNNLIESGWISLYRNFRSASSLFRRSLTTTRGCFGCRRRTVSNVKTASPLSAVRQPNVSLPLPPYPCWRVVIWSERRCIDHSITPVTLSCVRSLVVGGGQIIWSPLGWPVILPPIKLNADTHKNSPRTPPPPLVFVFSLFSVMYWPNNQSHQVDREYILWDSRRCLGRICFMVVSTLHIIERAGDMHPEACWSKKGSGGRINLPVRYPSAPRHCWQEYIASWR